NTHADSGGPAPQSGAAVPGSVPRPVPIRIRSRRRGHSKSDGLTPQRSVPFGRAHGRGGSAGDSSFLGRRGGVGWMGEGAAAPSPLPWDSFALSPFNPPTHPRGAAGVPTAVPKRAGTAGVPSKRPAAGAMPRTPDPDSWSTDNGLSSHGLAP